ncbi:MAG: extracellular solute-binding protein [Actinomycetota bacterium]|nr:extracellular solute-binding protein [Actinomycetota bacterium]
MTERLDRRGSRRDFLLLAAGAAASAALGGACGSGSDKPKAGSTSAGSKGARSLRIVQWSHFVPAYDQWFDGEYTKRWGEEHDVDVVVEHVPLGELPSRADGEVATRRGHDIFGFISPAATYEDEVIDHREIVEEVTAKLGPITPLVERSIKNTKTGKYFGFSDFWAPNLVNHRTDVWSHITPGVRPGTWDDVLKAGARLKAKGYPLGIGLSPDFDSNLALQALMHAYGSSLQDGEGKVAINSPATVEAVKIGAEIFRTGMTEEVLTWDAASNNRFLAGGKGSLILNPVSAIRAVEKQDAALAGQVALAPAPAGPSGRLAPVATVSVFVIWRFSKNQELAKQFLVDLALNYREAFVRSESFNLPAFPGAVGDLDHLLANDATGRPADKYSVLATATEWSTNFGHPGNANAATDEVFNRFYIPKMFAAAAAGEMSAVDAVKAAEAEITPVFDKWRERGKV